MPETDASTCQNMTISVEDKLEMTGRRRKSTLSMTSQAIITGLQHPL